ncbi:MAG: ribonuclease HII [Acidobacteria bacterium]|nr:ribonuclease HII [Acidobacteriota bacterium]
MEPFEEDLRARGVVRPAGLDEVGRGALFGPVLAGAVILDPARPIDGLNDSKRLSRRQREAAFGAIAERAVDWAVGLASAPEIDRINILQATHLAMRRALAGLRHRPDHLLVDALEIEAVEFEQTPIVKGDARCESIAAASIVAKCARDALLAGYGRAIRGYGLSQNMGYGTEEHRAAIMRLGFSDCHRKTFRVQGTLPF